MRVFTFLTLTLCISVSHTNAADLWFSGQQA